MIISLGIAMYFVSARPVNQEATDQALRQQQTIARAEASNITSFFQAFGNSIAVLAQLRTVENPDANTLRNMQAFVEQWRASGVIGGILLLDKNGEVTMNANVLGTKVTGVSLADRDYFLWAKDQKVEGDYFVGQSVISRTGASKGQVVTVVASPIFRNGEFAGALASSVELRPLTERFLGIMKVSDSTDVYLIGQNGDLLVNTPASGNSGTSMFNISQGGPFLNNQDLTNKLKTALERTEEGSLQASYQDPKSNRVEPHLVAYSPVLLGNRNWLLVMSSPIQSVTDVTTPIHVRQIASLLLISLTLLVFGIVVSRENQNKL